MAKSVYETEIDSRISEIKRRMDDCMEEAKKEFDVTYRNFKNFGTIPFDHQQELGIRAIRNFQYWAHRLTEIEDVKRVIKKRDQRLRRDRNKSKSS